MSFYDGFLSVNQSPAQKWRNNLQDIVDKQFENSSTFWEDIYEEIDFGTDQLEKIVNSPVIKKYFNKISARITTLIDAKSGQRVNDDFRKIIFNQNNYHPKYGQRYYFDDNIWIIYSTNNIREDSSSAYIRRCNNTINLRQPNGCIHREPCYIDYKITETQTSVGEVINVPNSRIEVVCQRNKYTKEFKINTRFILNQTTYKIRQFIDYNNTKTFDNDTNYLLKFYADYDTHDYHDNLEDCVADDVNIPQNTSRDTIILLNDTYTLNLSQDNKYVFSINNLTEVPNNDYIFTKTDNSFSITNLRQNKKPIIIDYKSLDGTDIGQYTVYLGGISIE